MIRLEGKIVDADADWITIRVPYTPEYVRQDMKDAVVFLPDGRTRSFEQNAIGWALIEAITKHSGYKAGEKTQVNNAMKRKFLQERFDELTAAAIRAFSMSDVDVTTASLYISFLVDYVIENGIETKHPVTEMCEDIQKAVYSAMMHKKCIVCGRKADLHHVDRVGMGNDRREICHIGMQALPLCREHHQEAHQHGDRVLMDKYHLEPVAIDEKIARVYKLGREGKE